MEHSSANGQLILSALKTVTERHWHLSREGDANCAKEAAAEEDTAVRARVHADFERWSTVVPDQNLLLGTTFQELAQAIDELLQTEGWKCTHRAAAPTGVPEPTACEVCRAESLFALTSWASGLLSSNRLRSE